MIRLLTILLISFSTCSIFTSCEKDKTSAPVYPSFEEFLKSESSLSMFSQALDKAQLQSFKSGQGPYTWFAPTNTAFTDAGITQAVLDAMTPSQVSYLLLYQLINPTSIPLKPVFTNDMIAQTSFARVTQLGQSVYLGNYKDSFYVNGNSLISTNRNVSNGVVHIINKLNVPPNLRGNIQAILTSTGQHSLFIAALTRAVVGAGPATRWSALAGTAAFTVIAPTDAAMTAAGYTTASIAATPVLIIDSLVRYHMFSGSRLFTNDLGANNLGTFLSSIKKVQASNFGRSLKGINNATPVNVTNANILGTNGVVHVVDGVLRY